MKAFWEATYPLLVGLFVAAGSLASWYGSAFSPSPAAIQQTLPGILGVAGVALGVLIAMQSVLITVIDRPLLQQLRKLPQYGALQRYVYAAVNYSFWCMVFTSVFLFIEHTAANDGPVYRWYAAAWLGVTAAAFAAYYRVARIYFVILFLTDPPVSPPPPRPS